MIPACRTFSPNMPSAPLEPSGWRRRIRKDIVRVAVASVAALGVVQFLPAHVARSRALSRLGGVPVASASPDAFGRSGNVRTLFALPGEDVLFPLTVNDARGLRYRWIGLNGRPATAAPQPLPRRGLAAPAEAGFYRLALTRSNDMGAEAVLEAPVLAVMAPFRQKVGGVLNGYRIGTYVSERLRSRSDVPAGFVEVWPEALGLQVSSHLRLADFLTRDAKQAAVWPKYVALSPRLLDKLELVIAEVTRGRPTGSPLSVAVQSGFRTPAHNQAVSRAARDSRHQHGDAADVAMDANADGRLTAADGQLVAQAVDRVERAHPDLAGGLGLYVSRRYRTPYVHIDARGARTRWRG